jgi:hypothetical protein
MIPEFVKENEHETPNKGQAVLKILAEHTAQQLKERDSASFLKVIKIHGELSRESARLLLRAKAT